MVESRDARYAAARGGRRMARAVAGALLAVACNTGAEIAGELLTGSVDQDVGWPGASLWQRVTVSPSVPATGDTLEVRSILRNTGTSAVPLTSTICGVHLRGSLAFEDPFVRCAGYSMSADLAPGDSVIDARRLVVTAGPGSWVLEVRQLLEPSVWVSVPVRVRMY